MRCIKIYSFLFLYLLSCITLVIDFHYCGGELAYVALYHADEDGCCGDNEGKVPGCCKDKLVVIDTDDNEEVKKYVVKKLDLVRSVSNYPPVENILIDYHIVLEKTVIPINHAPPDDLLSPLFIKNRVLLI